MFRMSVCQGTMMTMERCGRAVWLFNIITLMTDSFGSVVALQGLFS
jgi:hypothetical protein